MAGSYEKINYRLRPAKCIERKMLCEAFRRLHEFASIESYRYVGFGSTYFSDFILFHKNLGISHMISIEKDIHIKDRIKFNIPFNCIDVKYGNSTDVLESLPWDFKSIIWLDYDGQLTQDVLADIKHVFAHIVSGSVVVISCSAQVGEFGDRLSALKEILGDKAPDSIEESNLNGWGVAKLFRKIIVSEIKDTLSSRNGIRPTESKFTFRQLFNFNYADGAKMLTVGGIIHEAGEKGKVEKCCFSELSFTRMDDDSYLIDVPNLTYKEIRYLDSKLPSSNPDEIDGFGIPRKQIKNYADYYRYFPNFAESEV